MRLVTQVDHHKQPVLLVDPGETYAGIVLARRLQMTDDVEVIVAREFPTRLDQFLLIFTIDVEFPPERYEEIRGHGRVVLIYTHNIKRATIISRRIQKLNITNAKVINLSSDHLDDVSLERILWFTFAHVGQDQLLDIVVRQNAQDLSILPPQPISPYRRSFKKLVLLLAALFVTYNLLTVAIIFSSSLMYVSDYEHRSDTTDGGSRHSLAVTLNTIGTMLYRPTRPALLFFSLGLVPDTLLDLNAQLDSLATQYDTLEQNSTLIGSSIFQQNKNDQQKTQLLENIEGVPQQLNRITELSSSLIQKIPHWNSQTEYVRSEIASQRDSISKIRDIPALLPKLTARGGDRTYLIIIADSSSQQPGGGILRYWGLLHMHDMSITSVNMFDSTSVDQARKIPLESTSFLKDLPNQSKLTLEHSLNSPDFQENLRTVQGILTKESQIGGIDGALLITQEGMRQLTAAYTPLYIPELHDTITPQNYLIKSEIAPDRKTLVTSVLTEIIRRAGRTPSDQLVPILTTALNQKQIVFYSLHDDEKDIFNRMYWSGTLPIPRCIVPNAPCTSDYIFPLQANIGDLPINRYIQKSLTQRVFIDSQGTVTNTYSMKLKNTSLEEVYPGGMYHAYIELILPQSSKIKSITVDGIQVPQIKQLNSTYLQIGFPVDVGAQVSRDVEVQYVLNEQIRAGRSVYQLVMQKQIGSSNSDIALEVLLPKNIKILDRNFSPIVKDGRIFYNTILNADKLFVLTLDNKQS